MKVKNLYVKFNHSEHYDRSYTEDIYAVTWGEEKLGKSALYDIAQNDRMLIAPDSIDLKELKSRIQNLQHRAVESGRWSLKFKHAQSSEISS